MVNPDPNRGVIPPYLASGKYATEHERFDIKHDDKPEISNDSLINNGARRGFRGAHVPQPPPVQQQPQQLPVTVRRQPVQQPVQQPAQQPVQQPVQQRVQRRSDRLPHLEADAHGNVNATFKAPPQVDLRVGEHHDGLWSSSESFGGQPYVDNNEFVSEAAFNGDPAAQQVYSESGQPVQAEDQAPVAYVDIPPEVEQRVQAQRAQVQREPDSSDPPKVSAYVIMVGGEVVELGTSDEVKAFVEELIYNRKIDIDSISVFKRLKVGFGVFIT